MGTARRYQQPEQNDRCATIKAYWANPAPFEAERAARQAELNAQIDAAVRRANPHPWEKGA